MRNYIVSCCSGLGAYITGRNLINATRYYSQASKPTLSDNFWGIREIESYSGYTYFLHYTRDDGSVRIVAGLWA